LKKGEKGEKRKKQGNEFNDFSWEFRRQAVRPWSRGAKRRNKLVSGKETFAILFKCSP
jgi:hypothetical protein